ncbi:cytochrome c oxidase subunit II [Methylacidimicrobium cyclopophantes]|uniref:cytochrome-c oxidase n=1 Tax=Methylacidimicrobium cyclopophantes TaxID=1041766 RepID=A0A5E6MA37_9BACT|nr:hypothetical protein [Methylacidimicrobium cyclopophantes]VVM06087.1 cytochrome c oxidase subunit II [Methylacidimicrobium cyclopophantes]
MSEHGKQIDEFMETILWFSVILFAIWFGFFVYALARFRANKNPNASYEGLKADWPKHLEWTIIFVEMVLLFGFSVPLWGNRVLNPPGPGEAVTLEAVAQQFGWIFHYPGPDGRLGRRDMRLADAMNPIGIDKSDPASKDDIITMNEMHVPVGKPVLIYLGSRDVVHNYYVIQMRIQRDAIPGLTIPMWFTPTHTGRFEIACGQLCGVGHFAMKGFLVVDTQSDYEAWLKQMGQLSQNNAPIGEKALARR